jgi:hypothetical protein
MKREMYTKKESRLKIMSMSGIISILGLLL